MESVPEPMHVLCPSCATAYEIATLVRPRRLRCAKCGAEWRELPPAADAARDADGSGTAMPALAMPEVPAPGPTGQEPEGREALSLRPARSPSAWRTVLRALRREDTLLGLWILSLAVMVAASFAFWHWRVTIAHWWPPSLRLYRLLPRPPCG